VKAEFAVKFSRGPFTESRAAVILSLWGRVVVLGAGRFWKQRSDA
jgi:hypothetical protein